MQREPRAAGVRLLDSRTMEKDEALIEAVRDYQCLYNSKSASTTIAVKLYRTGEQRYLFTMVICIKNTCITFVIL